jgi:ABC-type antimicrobial peptide transport system permease subunit
VDYFTDYVEWEGKEIAGKVVFTRLSTQYDYTATHHIHVIAGRDFSPQFPSDSGAVLINKTAMELMHMKDPIGRRMRIREGEKTIIGVTEDVLRSPFEPIRPLYMGMLKDGNNHISVRLKKTDDLSASLKVTNQVFKKLDPLNVDDPQFVDERFAWNFRSIETVSKLSNLFALLAVLLTALGVFGLAAYTAEQRTKEIAIRKIFGASLRSLVLLLSDYFIRIVLISVVIAAPISWWLMDRYLQNYSYRINVPWWTIPFTSIVILTITLFIVFTQVARTSLINPVDSLKDE